MKYKAKSLPDALLAVIRDKSTEHPFTGKYESSEEVGTYLCRLCGFALFRSEDKFNAYCGWPSFDQEIPGNIAHTLDEDGARTEILCARCHAHLGHVFEGEGFTYRNIRHCVNSASLDFVANATVVDSEEAILAAGCFWGVEYYFKKLSGVLKVESGYIGGTLANPTYEDVCSGNTGHLEAIRVLYDPSVLSYEDIVKYFFEIHDFTQTDGQGPDIGTQYLSACFYYDRAQLDTISELKDQLKAKGYGVATQALPVTTFWPAEEYHQDYYQKSGQTPYCHRYRKIW